MLKRAVIMALVMSTSLAFAQLDTNSVTVTASRNVNLQPDQAVFGVRVDSALDTTLDDIITALQGSGIGLDNLSGVRTIQQFAGNGQQQQPMLAWSFLLSAPLSKIKDTIAMLTNLQQGITQKNIGLTLSFNVEGTQVSQQLQQSRPCAIADLLADARAQAQKLANAGGLNIGSILAMSSSTSTSISNGVGYASFLLGYAPGCSVTVRFALGPS